MRKIKYNSTAGTGNFDCENSVPFVRFLNEFEAQKSLFSKEGIAFESKISVIVNFIKSCPVYRNI